MPFLGLGLHVIVALFFAIHAVRSGREMYWLFILFAFPLLGSIVYFFAIYWPSTRMQHTVRKAAIGVARSLDPGREVRNAEQAFELTPTAQNEMRLARALLESGEAEQAAEHFEACLKGPFANDPEIRLGAARARLQNGNAAAALSLAESIRKQSPAYRPEQVGLLLAQAYAQLGRTQEARAEFESAVRRFGSFEAHAEYAIWALAMGETETANTQYAAIEAAMKHWSTHAHSVNKPLLRRVQAAFETTRKA